MKRTRTIGSVVILAAFAAAAHAADGPGLAVGDQAPDFKLKDQKGQEQSLAGMLENGNVALVFHRSASW